MGSIDPEAESALRAEQTLEELMSRLTPDLLDDLCDEAASKKATAVNNEGVYAQLYYLTQNGYSIEDIADSINRQKEEAEAEQRRDEKRGLYADKVDIAN